MPELPDVEHFRRTFERYGAGRRVDEVLVTDDGILRNVSARELDAALRGCRFREPGRRGKWLIAWTDGPTPLVHFGMTGGMVWNDDAGGRHRHDRVIFVLDRGELRYRNMRKLGGVWLAGGPQEVDELLGGLGPDALDVGRAEFLDLLGRRRGRIKPALMDQSLIAGVGNLVADEVLWTAGVNPTRRIEDLGEDERAHIARALGTVLRRTVDEYPDGFRTRWSSARGRPAARCPRCRTTLSRAVVGGRTTYSCPTCQP